MALGKSSLMISLTFVLASACTSVTLTSGEGAPSAGPSGAGAGQPASASPVVLELFTSQGCSSCPSADRLLSKLGHDASLKGRIVPLAFHVDYWDSIGWTDPFSSAKWTERQSAYSHQLKLDGVYTPQIVVNGVSELVGSDESGILAAVQSASAAKVGRIALDVEPDASVKLTVNVSAETPVALGVDAVEAWVAVVENDVTTDVKRGENSGQTLVNDFVVRGLERAFSLAPVAGAAGHGKVTFDVGHDWNAHNIRVAAFLQDPKTLRMYGAAAR